MTTRSSTSVARACQMQWLRWCYQSQNTFPLADLPRIDVFERVFVFRSCRRVRAVHSLTDVVVGSVLHPSVLTGSSSEITWTRHSSASFFANRAKMVRRRLPVLLGVARLPPRKRITTDYAVSTETLAVESQPPLCSYERALSIAQGAANQFLRHV